MQFIIGVDIGTSGTKAIAFTTLGEVIGNAYSAYAPLPAQPGYHELDTETLFEAVLKCLGDVVLQTRGKGDLLGVSFSSAMHSLIAVDNAGQPLTNVITWADLRSAVYAAALKNTDTGQRIYRHTGTPIHPMSPLCKLLWMKEHQPEVFAAADKFISIKEYIFYKLFGQYLVDDSLASGTGLFDIYTRTWYNESLLLAGITAQQLSQPVSTTHIVRGLKKEYATRLLLDAQTAFIIGASDGCLANLGSNAVHAGDVAVTIGTSGAVRMITHAPKHDEQERIFNYILTDRLYVSGGPINNGLSLIKWYAEGFLHNPIRTGEDIEAFVNMAALAPAGCDGLLFLPYVQGERAPVWDAQAKGVFFGIHAGHDQHHFMRAIIEGINYSLYQVAASVKETLGSLQHIYASGGFIRSRLWLQWLADLFGKEIAVTNSADASTLGAAILGLQALCAGPQPDTFIQVQERFYPQEAVHRQYCIYYPVYASLYEKLKDDFHRLSAIRE